MTQTSQTSFHESVMRMMAANDWPYAFACGYASGSDDKANNRPHEHKPTERDDYAMGYFRAYPIAMDHAA